MTTREIPGMDADAILSALTAIATDRRDYETLDTYTETLSVAVRILRQAKQADIATAALARTRCAGRRSGDHPARQIGRAIASGWRLKTSR